MEQGNQELKNKVEIKCLTIAGSEEELTRRREDIEKLENSDNPERWSLGVGGNPRGCPSLA